MKKFLLFAGLLVAGAAQAQITPEAVRPGNGYAIRMSNGDYKYQLTETANNRITIYNTNNSVYRQFTAPTPATGYLLSSVSYVSDALFDTNPNTLEYLAQYRTATGSGVGRAILYSETGAQIAVFDSAAYALIYTIPGVGTKMMVNKSAYSTSGVLVREYVRFYGLPGQLALRTTAPGQADVAVAYPNPAQSGRVNLPYAVASGQLGTVRVYDAAGRVVGVYQVDSHTDHLEMSTADLSPGVYTYHVETSTGTANGSRFVIQ